MPTIEIAVTDKIAQVQGNPIIVCGNSDYTVIFDFDAEWNAYENKTARFVFIDQSCVRHWIDVQFSGTSCPAPVLSCVQWVEIGVYAGSIRTSSSARIRCLRSATDGKSRSAQIKSDFYDWYLGKLAEVI